MNIYNSIVNNDLQTFELILIFIFLLPVFAFLFFRKELNFLCLIKQRVNNKKQYVKLKVVPLRRLRRSLFGDVIPYGLPTLYRALAYHENGSYDDVTELVSWHSLSYGAISMSSDGVIVAHQKGKLTLVVSYHYYCKQEQEEERKTISCVKRLEISDSTIESIYVYGFPYEMAINSRALITAYATYSDGYVVDITDLVEWRSSDMAMLSVSPGGVISAYQHGEAFIECIAMGVTSAPECIYVN